MFYSCVYVYQVHTDKTIWATSEIILAAGNLEDTLFIPKCSVNNPMESHIRKILTYSHSDFFLAVESKHKTDQDTSIIDFFGVEFNCEHECLCDKHNRRQ